MKTWDQFFPDVIPLAPGVSHPAASRAIMRATQEFCQKTRALVVELDPVRVTAATSGYDLALPSRRELVRIEFAKVDGREYPVWVDGDKPSSSGNFIYCRDGLTFGFSGAMPAVGASVVLTCSLSPATNAPGIDDVIYRRYDETIALGALARLMGSADKQTAFDSRCADVRVALWRGNANTTKRVRANFF